MSADISCDVGRMSKRWVCQEMVNDQPWLSATSATIAVVQINASRQPFPQSGFGDCCFGQPVIASGMAVPMPDIASICMIPEFAIAFSAKPMLTGPRMAPSIAKTQNRR